VGLVPLETVGVAMLHREAHARMLGNGLCTCFRTGTEFLPVLIRQRDHARDHGQDDRAELFGKIIQDVEQAP